MYRDDKFCSKWRTILDSHLGENEGRDAEITNIEALWWGATLINEGKHGHHIPLALDGARLE